MWTIDELVERVREALAAEYSGATDGRVRDVPDRRAIRWYTTIGLVDRPLGMRGRTALYGPRHLQQLVAIKRLQAAGRSLSDIQVEFSHVTDVILAEFAHVPESLLEAGGPEPDQTSNGRHMRFWAQVAPSTELESAPPGPPLVPQVPALVGAPSDLAAPVLGPRPSLLTSTTAGAAISGVALGGGATLLVPYALSDDDRADIVAAATPLLELLRSRGLIDGRSA